MTLRKEHTGVSPCRTVHRTLSRDEGLRASSQAVQTLRTSERAALGNWILIRIGARHRGQHAAIQCTKGSRIQDGEAESQLGVEGLAFRGECAATFETHRMHPFRMHEFCHAIVDQLFFSPLFRVHRKCIPCIIIVIIVDAMFRERFDERFFSSPLYPPRSLRLVSRTEKPKRRTGRYRATRE